MVLVRRRVEVENGYSADDYGDDPYGGDPFADDSTQEYRWLELVEDDVEFVSDEGEATPIPVTFHSGGSAYVRGDTGERVEQADTVRWPTGYATPAENDRIHFEEFGERLVESVAPKLGRHGVDYYELELGGT